MFLQPMLAFLWLLVQQQPSAPQNAMQPKNNNPWGRTIEGDGAVKAVDGGGIS